MPGAVLDGVPEPAAIGVTLVDGGGTGIAVVAAAFLSIVSGPLSAAVGPRRVGHSARGGLRPGVALVPAAAAAAGCALLGGASPAVVAGVRASAAGAVLTVVADTMVPGVSSTPGTPTVS